MQRMFCSFEKNAKESENVAFFWKERMPNPVKNYNLAALYLTDLAIYVQMLEVYNLVALYFGLNGYSRVGMRMSFGIVLQVIYIN